MEDALFASLGIAGTLIVGLLGAVIALMRRNGHNPNLATLDEKLNQILLVLTKIETVMKQCPASKE